MNEALETRASMPVVAAWTTSFTHVAVQWNVFNQLASAALIIIMIIIIGWLFYVLVTSKVISELNINNNNNNNSYNIYPNLQITVLPELRDYYYT